VAGLATTFGSGAMTNNVADLGNAACIAVIGSNTTHAHPIIGLKIKETVISGAKLIVINPRRIELCDYATLWLRPRIGTDIPLVMGMIRVILEEGLEDKKFIAERCEGFDELKESLKDYPLDRVEHITGVPRAKIIEAARLYATTRPAAICYTLGITEHTHGTEGVMSMANLAMVTGNIGRPGTGVNPLRGQNNVQGACDMGALPNVYPGYQAVDNPEVRRKFEAAWGVNLSSTPGMKLTEMYQAAYEKRLKAIYLTGEDPVLTEPDANHVVKALSGLEFFAVQEIFLTETAKLAHVVLPSASYASDDGTFTNTERRVQRVRKAVPAPGEAKPVWQTVCLIARKMGKKGFDFGHASEVWREMASLTPSMAGISYERLESGGIQWPCPTAEHPGTPILHTQIFSRGKGKFVPLSFRPSAEMPDNDFPLVLTTGRHLLHYHAGSMTHKSGGIESLYGEEFVEINPRDAAALGVQHRDMVTVTSRRGQVTAWAKLTDDNPEGLVYMNFHFRETPTNVLTSSAPDPISATPELKVCAVRIQKADSGGS
jgi:formate dehydrogenase (NADP+) alpha subunit